MPDALHTIKYRDIQAATVCFSGGHSSALVAFEAVKKFGKNNVILLNHDISPIVEHKDIKRFKNEVAESLDIPITYANANDFETTTPLDVSLQKGCFRSHQGNQLCTYYLKTKPFQNWLNKTFGGTFDSPCTDTLLLYGFDAKEVHRIQRRSSVMAAAGYFTDYPLAYWERTIQSTREKGILPPSTYSIFKHANCIGCLKAGKQHWYCVYCLRPDIWQQALATEKALGLHLLKDVFLEDLETQFEIMRNEMRICPDDKTNSASFWALVNRTLPEQQSFLPCDCSY